METWQIFTLITMALILSKVFDYILNKVIKKVDTDYVTTLQCKECSTRTDQNDFKKEIREKLGLISGILLVLVSGKEVSQDLMERLISGGGR